MKTRTVYVHRTELEGGKPATFTRVHEWPTDDSKLALRMARNRAQEHLTGDMKDEGWVLASVHLVGDRKNNRR